nr:DNA-directed DNA polymerase [Tanacetum cinerariifolium]
MGSVDGPGLVSLGHEPITWTILDYSLSPFTPSSLLHYKTTLTDNILRPTTFLFDFSRLTLRDSGNFLIPCDFPGIDVCHALADLGASINLIPLSIWKKLSLSELTPTRMTLELADRSITRPRGVVEDMFVKVGKFHFPVDFVVVDFKSDPRVPLILRRSFLRTGRALIDVYGEEITLRVNDEFVTFNLDQTMRYSLTYDDNSVNRVGVIDIACEEFVQDVLDFQYNPKSSNHTLVYNPSFSEKTDSDFYKEPIVKSSSPTLTPFGESDFFLEEIKDFLNDESIPTGIENSFYDPEGDILYLEKLLNNDPFQLPSMELKQAEETKARSSIKEPHKLELKEFPSHLDPWVSPIHYVPKKGGMTVVANENNELIPIRLVTGWSVCIDYRKLNDATRKDHFPLPFMDQMLERLAENEFYFFLDGFSGYFQIPIDPKDQEKTTSTCPYGTFAYRRMPFGLCNAPNTFQREGIVLGHKILKPGIEVDREKVDVIAKLHHPTTLKGLRSFLGHAGFYRRFIQDFSKIARPMTHLLEKETPFVFSKECVDAFNILKQKLTEALILVVLDWNLPFELMCDASDFAIGAVLGQRKMKHFQPIHYARKTMTEAQIYYTTTEKEMLVVVYAFEKFRPYLVLSKCIVYTDHSALKYLLNKQDAKLSLPPSDEWSSVGFQSRIETYFKKDGWGKPCLVALKHVNFDLKTTGDHRKLQLNELNELRDQAYENSLIYKERSKKLHDSKIKNRIFNVGDQVLLFNSRLKIFSRNLKTRWSGPFTITQVFPYGTVELSQPNGPNFKVNSHRVKHYFGGDIPSKVVSDLHTIYPTMIEDSRVQCVVPVHMSFTSFV